MKVNAFILICSLVILFLTIPLMSLENIKANDSSPLFSSYIAAYERSNYFVDEGYHLVYYDDHQPIRLVNESSGEIDIAFRLGDVVVYNLEDFYQKPVVTLSYPDALVLEAEPFVGLKIVMKFVVYYSNGLVGEIHYNNQTKRTFMLYFSYGSAYQKIKCQDIKPGKSITITYKEPAKGVYFQQDKLKGFDENRHSRFRFNQRMYAWGGFRVYKKYIPANELLSRYEYLNGSITGELSQWALSFNLEKKNGTFKFAKATVQAGNQKNLTTLCDKLIKISFDEIPPFNQEKLKNIPILEFTDNDEKFLFYGGIYLGRQQFYSAAGQFPYPYYVFSREPTWGWGHEGQEIMRKRERAY